MLCARTAGISLTTELASVSANTVRTRRLRGHGIIETIFADRGTILLILSFEGYDEVTAGIPTERFITWDERLENGADSRDLHHSGLAKGHLKLVR
jgi:hypothetical protein